MVLAKRKNAKNIRLSISAAGKVRVGMPNWVPYAAGISFVKSRSEWVNQHTENHQPKLLNDGDRIGKSYRLNYRYDSKITGVRTRIIGQNLHVTTSYPLASQITQSAVIRVSERALKLEAAKLLPPRLESLAKQNKYSYQKVLIKRMASRWGSCSSHGVITLNYFLMQLPWEMIDYVLTHELIHTKHLNHSPVFWAEFEKVYPNAKQTRRQIKQFRPVINSIA